MRNIFKAFSIMLMVVLSVNNAVSQTISNYNPVANTASQTSSVDEYKENCEDLPAIVTRLQQSGSGVTVNAPRALLMRAAVHMEEDVVGSLEENNDEGEDLYSKENSIRTKTGKTVGYRVQVYADNNVKNAKIGARQRERAIENAFPQYSTYVSYSSPYWRLRVGDFPSQYDAEKAAAEIRQAFPGYAKEVRVVRDRINVR